MVAKVAGGTSQPRQGADSTLLIIVNSKKPPDMLASYDKTFVHEMRLLKVPGHVVVGHAQVLSKPRELPICLPDVRQRFAVYDKVNISRHIQQLNPKNQKPFQARSQIPHHRIVPLDNHQKQLTGQTLKFFYWS